MAVRLVPYYVLVTDYNQADEDALALTLTSEGATLNSVFIHNTTLGKTRVWTGTQFVNAPLCTPDGGTWEAGAVPVTEAEKTTWNAKQNNLGFTPAADNHNHSGVYSPAAHNHAGVYEPANANIQALAGGGNKGYVINVQALTSSPADGQTIYFGMLPKAPVTAQGTSKIYIRSAGIIKRAEIYCFAGTAGSNESWSVNIRLNSSSDTLIQSLGVSASERVFSNTNLNIAVSAGDYIEIKCVNPTWATNPLTCIFGGYIYIE